MKRKQMMISFGAYDDDVYDFLQGNKNASAFIRMLVRGYMRENKIPTYIPAPTTDTTSEPKVVEPKVVEEKVVEEKVVEPKSKAKDEVVVNTSNETSNRDKIKELEL